MGAVKRALREQPVQAVPPWLRDAHNATSQSLGNGQGYRYSHDYPQAISGQDYMLEPQTLLRARSGRAEARSAERLAQLQALKARIGPKRLKEEVDLCGCWLRH